MRIKTTLLMLLGLLAVCQAQLKVTLTFESAGPKEVFVASELPKAPPASPVKAEGASLDFSIPAFGGNDRIYVWDRQTNNIASKAIKEIANSSWSPKAADFNLIGLLTVRVEHKGQPVQAAKVSVSGKTKKEEKLLDPTGKGDVQFFGFPAGDLRVKVAFNTTDKKEGSQEQIFPQAIKRDKPEPVMTVAISDPVATVAETAGSTAPATSNTPPTQAQKIDEARAETSPIGKLILMLLALAAIGAVGWWVFNMVKKNPKEFESRLQKLGVQIPNQQDPNDAGAPTPVTPLAPPPPPQKIMLDDAEPTPLMTGVAAVASPVMTSTGEPVLVKETGERITLAEGDTEVGREEGLGLSLVGESTVSRRHATVTRTGKTAVLKDLGSTNGTFVNGTRLQGETALKPGDQVQFGSVRFRYEG